MKPFLKISIAILAITSLARAEQSCPAPARKPESPSISLLRKCCSGRPLPGPVQVEPLEMLRALSGRDAEKVESIAAFLTGQALPILDEDDLAFLEEIGVVKKSIRKILRPASTIYETLQGYNSLNPTGAYDHIARIRCGVGGTTTVGGETYPKSAYPMSTKGRPARIWPSARGQEEPRTGFVNWCQIADFWVEESVWIWEKGMSKPAILAAVPNAVAGLRWQYSVFDFLPSQSYNQDYFFRTYNSNQQVAEQQFDAAMSEFAVGLIPFVGGGVQFLDGATQGSKQDMFLGAVSIVGDFAGPLGAYADYCKLPKLAAVMDKSACVAGLVGNGATLYLTAKNFLNGEGTGLQAGMGTLATVQILATIVLRVKYKNTVPAAKVAEVPSIKPIDPVKVNCEAPFVLPDGLVIDETKLQRIGEGGSTAVYLTNVNGVDAVYRTPLRRPSNENRLLSYLEDDFNNHKALEPYGGPRALAEVVNANVDGSPIKGTLVERVPGISIAQFYEGGGRCGLTQDHIKSFDALLEKMRKANKEFSDVNPTNFMLTPDGRVVPIDTGLVDGIATDALGAAAFNRGAQRLRDDLAKRLE